MIVHHVLIQEMIDYHLFNKWLFTMHLLKEWLFTPYQKNDCSPLIQGMIVCPLLKELLFTLY